MILHLVCSVALSDIVFYSTHRLLHWSDWLWTHVHIFHTVHAHARPGRGRARARRGRTEQSLGLNKGRSLGGLEGGGFAAYPGADPASAAHTPRSAPQSAVGGARQSCGVCGDAASGTSPGGAHGNAARSPEGTSPAGRSVAGSVAGSERAERAREAKARAEQALAEEWGVTDGRLQATMQKRQARRAATLTLTLT